MSERLTIPEGHEDSVFIVSVSGGKDSTATLLAMREADIPHRAVFADTGWEAPETYEYLATLERLLGITIDRVGVPGGMRAKIRERAGFPARMQRWCTRQLKVEPLREYHDRVIAETDRDTINVVGIRAEESEDRAALPVFGFDDRWGGYVWRPMRDATVEDVIATHHRHGVPMNPLYLRGHSRVGCYPCIYATKEEIRLWALHAPESVSEIAALERECETLRAERNAETPGRYAHATASYFQARKASRDSATGKRAYLPVHVDELVAWSQTSRGGAQLPLIREQPDGGCFRWGMCEPPTPESSDDE